MPTDLPRSGRLHPRTVAASLMALVAAVAMQAWNGWDRDLHLALWIPTLLLAASAGLLHSRHLGAQVLARAAWWSNAILGVLVAMSGSSREFAVAVVLASTCLAALALAGRHGLANSQSSSVFQPVAFRASLLLAMVMALADTQSLLLFGSIVATDRSGHGIEAALMLGSAAVMVVALIGLFRLRVWGLALNLIANITIAALAAADCYELPDALVYALVCTAVLQLLLPLPMIAAMVRPRRLAQP